MRRRRFAVLLPTLLVAGCGYNQIQSLDERANNAQGQIEAQLQRRADLIPNLVNTVKGYAQHEQTIFTEVARAQQGLVGALNKPGGADPTELADANDRVSRAMLPIFTLVQAYPQLKADAQFMRLQDELTGTENRVAVARQDYNDAVTQYNTTIRTMPTALTAKVTGAKPRKYFQVTNPNAREAPTVDFSQPGAAPAGTPATPATPAAPAPRP
jgi:LemA protein